jgi:hypothetical protein
MRERAIKELMAKEMSMGTIEKIECGKSYDVKEMLLEGYVELLKRAETITDEEAERLGWKTASKLHLLREQYLSTITVQHSAFNNITCGGCGTKCGGGLYILCPSYGSYRSCSIPPMGLPDRNEHDFTEAVRKEFQVEL